MIFYVWANLCLLDMIERPEPSRSEEVWSRGPVSMLGPQLFVMGKFWPRISISSKAIPCSTHSVGSAGDLQNDSNTYIFIVLNAIPLALFAWSSWGKYFCAGVRGCVYSWSRYSICSCYRNYPNMGQPLNSIRTKKRSSLFDYFYFHVPLQP
jgi:hypothetical protein